MASLNAQLVCPLCPHERTAHLHFDLTGFLKHLKLFHAHQAGFRVTCGISGCQRSFSNFLLRTLSGPQCHSKNALHGAYASAYDPVSIVLFISWLAHQPDDPCVTLYSAHQPDDPCVTLYSADQPDDPCVNYSI